MDETTLLNAIKSESKSAVGWDNDAELKQARLTALEYYKGQMNDSKVTRNRSKTVSTDVADTIETWLPDILEIFTGGEDVVVFPPHDETDIEQAQQETDFISHVFFNRCDGYSVLEDCFLNAALMKSGIFQWYWDEEDSVTEKQYDRLSLQELIIAQNDGYELVEGEEAVDPETGFPTLVDVTMRKVDTIGGVKVIAVPPEDFAVAGDTDKLSKTTYCKKRIETRVQDLIAKKYDEAKVRSLRDTVQDDEEDRARDTAGEEDSGQNDTVEELRKVTIEEHYLRFKGDIWRVVTGNNSDVLLEKDKVDHIPFSCITPFRVPGRFYGLSLADKSIEVQRVKTGLIRGMLDGIHFSMNQRVEVNTERTNPNTIPDLLNNAPGAPVRSRGDAIKPLYNAPQNFNYPQAIEAADVMNERRTGVQRGQQGLNPDTLHDTASGAKILLSEGQKRTRRIARSFAETGIKDMFLGLHALIRKFGADKAEQSQVGGEWKEVDPKSWRNRSNMTIEIGVGSGGRDQEIAVMREVLKLQSEAMAAGSPLVSPENVYAASKRFMERAGIKNPDLYVTDPKKMQQQPGQEKPDPEMVKVQMDAKQKQDELQLKKYEIDTKFQLERESKQAEIILARERMNAEFAMQERKDAQDAQISANRPGGRLDA